MSTGYYTGQFPVPFSHSHLSDGYIKTVMRIALGHRFDAFQSVYERRQPHAPQFAVSMDKFQTNAQDLATWMISHSKDAEARSFMQRFQRTKLELENEWKRKSNQEKREEFDQMDNKIFSKKFAAQQHVFHILDLTEEDFAEWLDSKQNQNQSRARRRLVSVTTSASPSLSSKPYVSLSIILCIIIRCMHA